jgi:hypothetical protein
MVLLNQYLKKVGVLMDKQCLPFLLTFFFTCVLYGKDDTPGKQLNFERVNDSESSIAVLRRGDYLYTTGYSGLSVYDLTDPLAPRRVKKFPEVKGRQMVVEDNTLYVTARADGLWIVDIANPPETSIITRFDTAEMATGIDAVGDIVFVSERIYGTEILDCSNKKHPKSLGFLRGGEMQSVRYIDNRLYGGNWGHGRIHITDFSNPSKPVELKPIHMDGYADGMWVDGNICYGATGMHARKVPRSEQANRGNGLEIFDLSNPKSPRQLGGVKFPEWKLMYLDAWSVQVSDGLAYVTNSNNGLYVVDVKNSKKPFITASGRLPQYWNKEDCVCSVAVGKGILYVGAMNGGLYIVRYPQAVPPEQSKEQAPEVEGLQPMELPRFLRYDTEHQAHRLFLDGDTLYAACSHSGILVFNITPEKLILKNQHPIECSYDVAVRNGLLYSAEGAKGFAIYRMRKDGHLEEIGRDRTACDFIRLCSNPRFMLYTQGGFTVLVKDISDPKNMKDVFSHKGGGMFYTDTTAEQDLNGIIPVNRHGGGVIWLDLNGEKPLLKHHIEQTLADQGSAPTLLGKRYLLPANRRNGCYLLNPERPDFSQKEFVPLGKLKLSGTASADGNIIVFTHRATGDIETIDFSDIKNPIVLKKRSWKAISGSPGRAIFWNHRMLIPAGRQGILFEKQESN